jgi:hypothetical protein
MNIINPGLSYEARRSVRRALQVSLTRPLRPIARERVAADNINFITIASGRNTANNRKACFTPRDAAVTDITLGFPGFFLGNPETDNPFAYTVTAYVEYPAGTFTRAFCAAGNTLTVPAGRQIAWFDPVPLHIPANTAFWVKWFMSWTGSSVNFPLGLCIAGVAGEWCETGVGLSDQAGTTSVRSHSYPAPTQNNGLGFPVLVRGRTAGWQPTLGILGDSISQGVGDSVPDPVYGGSSFERAFRNVVGIINAARQSEEFTHYTSRRDGRDSALREAVTHLMINHGRNDISNGASAATVQARIQAAMAPWLARDVRVYGITVTPISSSTDTWATAANQTVSASEAVRQTYNTWLRANWRAIGMAGIFDAARAVDPTDSGKWGVDSGFSGTRLRGVATLTAGAIASVARPTLSGGSAYGGTAYPLSAAAHPCVVYAYPDDPVQSGGGSVTAATDGSGVGSSFSVVAGGAYTIPPLISAQGRWTHDGTHPSPRGMDEIIFRTGMSARALLG